MSIFDEGIPIVADSPEEAIRIFMQLMGFAEIDQDGNPVPPEPEESRDTGECEKTCADNTSGYAGYSSPDETYMRRSALELALIGIGGQMNDAQLIGRAQVIYTFIKG